MQNSVLFGPPTAANDMYSSSGHAVGSLQICSYYIFFARETLLGTQVGLPFSMNCYPFLHLYRLYMVIKVFILPQLLDQLCFTLCASEKGILLFFMLTSNLWPSHNRSQTLDDRNVLPGWCEAAKTPKPWLQERKKWCHFVLAALEGRTNFSLLVGYVIAFRVSSIAAPSKWSLSLAWYFVFPPKQLFLLCFIALSNFAI